MAHLTYKLEDPSKFSSQPPHRARHGSVHCNPSVDKMEPNETLGLSDHQSILLGVPQDPVRKNDTQGCPLAPTCTHTLIYRNTRTHAHTRTRTRTCAHAHTRTMEIEFKLNSVKENLLVYAPRS